MRDSGHGEILILADDPALARRRAKMLAGPNTRIWLPGEGPPPHEQLDLILIMGNAAGTTESADLPAHSSEVDPLAPGVIRLGGSGPADVHLEEEPGQPQLRLACRLLGQIVRLRRRLHVRSQVQSRLAQEALTDPLTGLANRRAWDRTLSRWLAVSVDAPAQICVAIFDLDHFKRINDAHGHPIGDEVLRAAGRAISSELREDDFVARLGGDEFGLLLWLPNTAIAADVVDRVRSSLPAHLARSATHQVTASAGFHLAGAGQHRPDRQAADLAFRAADAALRRAKRQGRDRTVRSAET